MFSLLREKLRSRASSFTKKVEEKEEVAEKTKEEPKKKIKEKSTKKEKPIKEKISENKKPSIKVEPELKEVADRQEKSTKQSEDSSSKEEVKEKIIEEKQGFFSKLISKVTKIKINEEDFNVYAEELEMLLLENNVALEVAEKIVQELKEKVVGKEFLKKEVEGQIKEAFKDVIYEILVNPFKIEDRIKEREDRTKPFVTLFAGINGTGKTTSIAKIAESLKKQKISCVLAAADTFRAASIEQIKKHGEKIGIPVIAHDYESDPAAVGFDATKYAEKNKIDCVLIDTAGRMHTAKNLMAQIEKIVRVCKPDLKIYVGESTTGNDAIEQVRSFNFAIGIDGIILSKADIDEKGGTALSVGYVTKRPILYLGTGQEYSSIEPFDKNKFIERLGL